MHTSGSEAETTFDRPPMRKLRPVFEKREFLIEKANRVCATCLYVTTTALARCSGVKVNGSLGLSTPNPANLLQARAHPRLPPSGRTSIAASDGSVTRPTSAMPSVEILTGSEMHSCPFPAAFSWSKSKNVSSNCSRTTGESVTESTNESSNSVSRTPGF